MYLHINIGTETCWDISVFLINFKGIWLLCTECDLVLIVSAMIYHSK
jgi:hypothetical protein